jgi:hypothetical protein
VSLMTLQCGSGCPVRGCQLACSMCSSSKQPLPCTARCPHSTACLHQRRACIGHRASPRPNQHHQTWALMMQAAFSTNSRWRQPSSRNSPPLLWTVTWTALDTLQKVTAALVLGLHPIVPSGHHPSNTGGSARTFLVAQPPQPPHHIHSLQPPPLPLQGRPPAISAAGIARPARIPQPIQSPTLLSPYCYRKPIEN